MIDFDFIKGGIVKQTKELVGHRLSTIETDTGTEPTVIQARQGGHKPDLPYIEVDISSVILPSSWLYNKYVSDDEDLVHEIVYEVFIDWRAYGTGSLSILQELKSLLSIETVRHRVQQEIQGTLVLQGDVRSTPDLLSTKYQEGALATNSFYVLDTLIDPNSDLGFIEAVTNTNGTLVTGVNGDINISFDVDTRD